MNLRGDDEESRDRESRFGLISAVIYAVCVCMCACYVFFFSSSFSSPFSIFFSCRTDNRTLSHDPGVRAT